jgi:ADP-ribose pyrophosphatase YjhB (NUDIX family)
VDYFQRIRQLAGKEPIIVPGAAGAILKDGKILLVRRRNLARTWCIPGGVQEIGESIQETARREIREEVGLDLAVGDLIAVYSSPRWNIEYPDGSRLQQLLFFFRMEGPTGPIRIQESEVSEYGFFRLEEIPDDTMDCCKQKVLDLTRYDGRPVFR